jgi:hypothetical protein
MTVLKEKRAGLLYLLGKGLVILSILALAFSFAGCGDTNGGSGTPPRWPDDHECPTLGYMPLM